MRSPHFYKAYSRLGLINPPVHAKEFNIGVEDAPDFVLDEHFLEKPSCVSKYRFPNPEDICRKQYWQILAQHLKDFKDLINKNFKPGQTQVVIGGDNSVTFSSLLAVQERLKDPLNLGYIQFDSHGECNKLSTSPSGNFHGMYMRPFLSADFEVLEINSLIKHNFPAGNVLYVGNLDLDGDEAEFIKKNKIQTISDPGAASTLKKFIRQFDCIHVNFDVDVMDKSVTPATGIPAQNGFLPQEIFSLLDVIRTHPVWSLDLAEINPKKEGAGKTVKFAQELLNFLLKK